MGTSRSSFELQERVNHVDENQFGSMSATSFGLLKKVNYEKRITISVGLIATIELSTRSNAVVIQ